ncbi:hypothetical protein [Breoghania sp.]|nr:hypothetical protein [Breoghania sp.]
MAGRGAKRIRGSGLALAVSTSIPAALALVPLAAGTQEAAA